MKYSIDLDNMPFFGVEVLKNYFPGLKITSLHQKIKRWLDKRTFLQLKKGLYMTTEYFRAHQGDPNFKVFIANRLRYPSYVTGAYVLQRYDMLTEVSYPVTSVTMKSSRTYINTIGTFVYFSISDQLYTGYIRENYRGETVYIASRTKALFDFFYFKYVKSKDFPKDLQERERISLEKLTVREKKEFNTYCQLCRLRIFKKLPYLLFHE